MIDFANYFDYNKNMILFDGAETGILNALSYSVDDFPQEPIGIDLSLFFSRLNMNTEVLPNVFGGYLGDYGLEYESIKVSPITTQGVVNVTIVSRGEKIEMEVGNAV